MNYLRNVFVDHGTWPSHPELKLSCPVQKEEDCLGCWHASGQNKKSLTPTNSKKGKSETGRIRLRFQTPSSVSFSFLTEFQGESSVSSSQPIICAKADSPSFFQNSPSLPQNSVSSQDSRRVPGIVKREVCSRVVFAVDAQALATQMLQTTR